MADPVPAPTVDLDAIRARADAATAGPWLIDSGEWQPQHQAWQIGSILRDRYGDNSITSSDRATIEFIAAARTDVPALVAELSVLRAREAQVRELCEPKPAKQDDQCRNCGDRRQHHRPGACDLCRFCRGFATRLPLIDADHLLAVLDGTTGSGKTG